MPGQTPISDHVESAETVYRLSDDGLTWFQSWWRQMVKSLPRQVLIWGSITVIMLLAFTGWRITVHHLPRIAGWVLITLLIILPVMNTIGLLSFKRVATRLSSYKLQLSDRQIVQQIDGSPDTCIRREEITSIEESTRYGLFINTADKRKRIVVWSTTDGYGEIKTHLSAWHPITTPSRFSTLRLPRGVISVVMFAAIGGIIVGRTPLVIVPASVITIGLMIWMLIETPRQSKMLRSARLLVMFASLFTSGFAVLRLVCVLWRSVCLPLPR